MSNDRSQPVRIGLLRLTDAAPVVAAQELGFFEAAGLAVALSVEPSWANISDKLAVGALDAAIMLPPLAFAIALGLRGIGAPLIVPMSLSLGGNALTVSARLAASIGSETGLVPQRLAATPPARIGVVHAFSTHNLLLRFWLARNGIDPDRDVTLRVIPPAETVAELRAGRIDGFCAGAPWSAVAARLGLGRTIFRSSEIWPRHPEKCFAVRADWADANPNRLRSLLGALIQAAQHCDQPRHASEVAALLAQPRYIGIDAELIRASLPDAQEDGAGDVDRSIFFRHAATFPWPQHARFFLAQMARWGHLGSHSPAEAGGLYRPDLYREAAASIGLVAPVGDDLADMGAFDPAVLSTA